MPRTDSAVPRFAPPIPNSYWVEPGRLLAGEYPGPVSQAEAMDRIQRLLAAGVNTFIDLTEEGELPSYLSLLPATASKPIEHHRWPITDHGLPRSPQYMAQILDAIEAAIDAGRCVYIHCHAGIGRTGTAIGCYLIRKGLSGDQALEHLQQLWQQCARSQRWPTVPETDDQYGFVRAWAEPLRQARKHAELTFAQRCEGAILGLAVGDALATMLASTQRNREALAPESFSAAWVLAPGPHTLLTQAVAESLIAQRGHNPDDQMQRYVAQLRAHAELPWFADFKRAVGNWQWSRKRLAGSHDPANLDPHSLPRSLAAALYEHSRPAAAMELAVEISRTTQQSPVVLDLCRTWTAVLLDALSATPSTQLLTGEASSLLRNRKLRVELEPLLQRQWSILCARNADALGCVANALLTAQDTPTFASGMMRALNDATTPALFGALAGAQYGAEAIPAAWRFALQKREHLQSLATRLVQ
jgi:ADP-ribosylglycohydrolase